LPGAVLLQDGTQVMADGGIIVHHKNPDQLKPHLLL
jgi:hypothetical protein